MSSAGVVLMLGCLFQGRTGTKDKNRRDAKEIKSYNEKKNCNWTKTI